MELGSCEAQHCFVNIYKNMKQIGHSSVSQDKGRKMSTMVKSSSQTDNYSVSVFVVIFPEFLCGKYSQIADTFIIYQTAGHLESAKLFDCSKCVSQIVCYIECYLYTPPIHPQCSG